MASDVIACGQTRLAERGVGPEAGTTRVSASGITWPAAQRGTVQVPPGHQILVGLQPASVQAETVTPVAACTEHLEESQAHHRE